MSEMDLLEQLRILLFIQSEMLDFKRINSGEVVQDVSVVKRVFVEEVKVAGPWDLRG
jgi:hypothetical protein